MKVRLKNSNGVLKESKVGFSWTTFFFGFIPALFRADFKWAVIQFIIASVLAWLTMGISIFVLPFVFGFMYNKLYIKDLLNNGYKPVTDADDMTLRQNGILS